MHYWGFQALPGRYKLDEWAQGSTDTLSTKGHHLELHDRVAIWRGQGQLSRGIVALAEVIEAPRLRTDSGNTRWIQGGDAEVEEEKVVVRFVIPPHLPLLEDGPYRRFLQSLPFGEEGTIFELDDQWSVLLAAAGGWPGEDEASQGLSDAPARDESWSEAKLVAARYMVKNAASQRGATVKYAELAQWVTSHSSVTLTAFSHDMNQLLEDVSRDERSGERPLLTAIVVRSEDGLPGNGFFDMVKRRGMTFTRRRKFWDEQCEEVWTFWNGLNYDEVAGTASGDGDKGDPLLRSRSEPPQEPTSYATTEHDVAVQRLEDELIGRYEVAIGKDLPRRVIQSPALEASLEADAFDVDRNLLIEAKAHSDGSYIRMAIGQLFDYVRFVDSDPAMAMLLPQRPSDELVELILNQGVRLIHETNVGEFMELPSAAVHDQK